MTKLKFKNGLLYTFLKVYYKGRVKNIDKIVIDTGAANSILSTDAVEDVGLIIDDDDEIIISVGIGGKQFAVIKQVDGVEVDGVEVDGVEVDGVEVDGVEVDGVEFNGFRVENCKIDIGEIDFGVGINGLLGLDLLIEAGVVLDLKNLIIFEAV
ncbi:hypothetical protein JCM14036_34020 [Desulfotomaculum defluvii]